MIEIFKDKISLKIVPGRNTISTLDESEELPENSDLLSIKKYGEVSAETYVKTGFKVLPKRVF